MDILTKITKYFAYFISVVLSFGFIVYMTIDASIMSGSVFPMLFGFVFLTIFMFMASALIKYQGKQ